MSQKTSASGTAVLEVTLPETMLAAAIDRFGAPEVITPRKLAVPVPGPNEILIALHTSGVGPWDAWHRQGGDAPANPRFPLVLGVDGAGNVAARGSRVRRFEEGERVYAYDYVRRGFYAEYVTVAADHAGRVPDILELGQAGAIPCVGLTALQGVDDALRVKSGDAVIVHGASGGVGHLALQFAKLRGARVLATASGEDGVALARELGADAAVDGKREDIKAAAQRFEPDGIDAVLAFVGGESLERCLDVLRNGGRLAYPNGIEPEPAKRHGVKFIPYDGTPGVRQFERLGRAIEAANLKVRIGAEFPLADAAKAHQRLEAGHLIGKMVLRI
jgi:NADPH:quinone reductase-like Zn-dependent oxidoreductase